MPEIFLKHLWTQVFVHFSDPPFPEVEFVAVKGSAPLLRLRKAEDQNGPIRFVFMLFTLSKNILQIHVKYRLELFWVTRFFFSNEKKLELYLPVSLPLAEYYLTSGFLLVFRNKILVWIIVSFHHWLCGLILFFFSLYPQWGYSRSLLMDTNTPLLMWFFFSNELMQYISPPRARGNSE